MSRGRAIPSLCPTEIAGAFSPTIPTGSAAPCFSFLETSLFQNVILKTSLATEGSHVLQQIGGILAFPSGCGVKKQTGLIAILRNAIPFQI